MFYSQVILARKGPLGKIWLAAHFDKKLTKNQILSTDIPNSVDSVLNPASPLALRVSGHLMLGIVRIYSRKVKYLLSDCTEAMWKIKLAFRPGNVDIDPALLTNINNVDDPRFFGNVSTENDFELENSAFPQFLLSSFSAQTAKAQKGGSALPTPEVDMNVSTTSTDINDLDAEGRKGKLRNSMNLARASLSTLDGGRPSNISQQSKFDETMAFEEGDLFNADFGGASTFDSFAGGDASLGSSASKGAQQSRRGSLIDMDPLEDEGPMLLADDGGVGGMQMEMDMDGAYYDMDQQQQGMAPADHVEDERAFPETAGTEVVAQPKRKGHGEVAATATASAGQKASPVKRANNKRNRLVIDERVELPTALIKERMADLSGTLRRDPSEVPPWKVPRQQNDRGVFDEDWGGTLDEMLMMPTSVKCLCPELQELFTMSTSNEYSLPFPVKAAFRLAEQRASPKSGTPSRRVQAVAAVADEHGSRTQSEEGVDRGASLLLPDYGAVGDVEFGGENQGFAQEEQQQYPQQDEYADMGGMDMGMQLQPFADTDMGRSRGTSFDGRGSLGGSSLDHSFNPAATGFSQRPQRVAASKNSVSESICMALEQQTSADVGGGRSQQQLSSDSSGLNERTRAVMSVLQQQFAHQVSVSFDEVTSGVTKRTAASCFLEILQLKTRGFLEATQSEPFGDITLMPMRTAAVRA